VRVPPRLTPVISAFSAAANDRLQEAGWRKRGGDVYTLDRGDFLGWLGLNKATKYDQLAVNPVVGVRHQPTEVTVAELSGNKPHGYLPPTLSSPVGYLRLGRFYEIAVVDEADVARAADELAALLERDALPFIEGHLTVEALVASLSERPLVPQEQVERRLPILLAHLGRVTEALNALAAGVEKRADRDDAEAEAYREFARGATDLIKTLA
jgi:hypothetical protein